MPSHDQIAGWCGVMVDRVKPEFGIEGLRFIQILRCQYGQGFKTGHLCLLACRGEAIQSRDFIGGEVNVPAI